MKISLEEATAPQLRAHAKTLNMRFPGFATVEQMRVKLAAAKVREIEADGDDEPQKPVSTAERDKRKVRVFISRSEEKGGDQPISLSVNGIAMRVPRGEEVPLPFPYAHALQNAVTTVYEEQKDEAGRPYRVERNVQTYPHQILG